MSKEKKFITCDGNEAAAHISYMFTEVAAIYPITPSSPMAEHVDEWAAAKDERTSSAKRSWCRKCNLKVVLQVQFTVLLQAGALTTTYTASQGLLLMIPNMYKIAGELLPAYSMYQLVHLASHALVYLR
jgi:pyruvate-ferredoxin/flavodoxin oxidoreductase